MNSDFVAFTPATPATPATDTRRPTHNFAYTA